MAYSPDEQSRVLGYFSGSSMSRVTRFILAIMAAAIAFVVIIGFVPGSVNGDEPGVVEGSEAEERQVPQRSSFDNDWDYDARVENIRQEENADLESLRQKASAQSAEEGRENSGRVESQERVRKVRRFEWESPAETRGKVWNIPVEDSLSATLNGFLRICISEADGNLQDCVGIWQVMSNIRRRSCERGHVRRITECDENGETMLSVMRRSQRHVMGMMPLRNSRAGWIRNMDTECEVPEGWTGSDDEWNAWYMRRCQNVVALGRTLIADEPLPQSPGSRLVWLPGNPITWGGRCETKNGACDDRIACARGLSRIAGTDTHNAFWRRPLTPDEVDPICVQMGYGHLNASEQTAVEEQAAPVAVVDSADNHVIDPT